jgi:multiple sugar transport system permease protein
MAATTVLAPPAKPSGSKGSGRRQSPRKPMRLREHLTGHGFIAGAAICFALFSWWPMIHEFIMSFQAKHFDIQTGQSVTKWVGWHNYINIWHDPSFKQAWENTGLFTLLALLVGYAVPFFIAVLVNEFRHAQGYLRVLVYLPVMLPPTAGLFLFKMAYYPDKSGIFNYLLSALHLPTSQWVQSTAMVIPSLVLASTWLNMGGTTLIYLASLQDIPGELYEASELDGANIFQRIWHVTIPQTRMILSLMFLLQVIGTMQFFIEPLILAGGGGPAGSATGLVYLMYQHAFKFGDLNGGAALGVILMLVLIVFAAVYQRLAPKQD